MKSFWPGRAIQEELWNFRNGNLRSRKINKLMVFSFQTICLLVVLITTVTGCASSYKTHPELSQRKSAIRNVGLLPPMVSMYEEQVGLNLVFHDDWSRQATESLRTAFVDEMAANRLPIILISGESHEANAMADLFKAVEFSIGRHAYDNAFEEAFPGKVHAFDYSLGPAQEMMEEQQVDAVWIVGGYNLLPTTGAQLTDVKEIALTLTHALLSDAEHSPHVLMKVEFRAALVDKSGAILFYYRDWPSSGDVRDPSFARGLVRELLSHYREAVPQ